MLSFKLAFEEANINANSQCRKRVRIGGEIVPGEFVLNIFGEPHAQLVSKSSIVPFAVDGNSLELSEVLGSRTATLAETAESVFSSLTTMRVIESSAEGCFELGKVVEQRGIAFNQWSGPLESMALKHGDDETHTERIIRE